MKIVEKPKEENVVEKKVYKETEETREQTIVRVKVNGNWVGNVISVGSNCKFSMIDYIHNSYSRNKEEMRANINSLLKRSRLAVLIQTTSLDIVTFLQENYEIYSLVRLPIGYSSGYQYHITLRNKLTRDSNFNYARSSKGISIKDVDSLDKEIIQIFKDKRRKVDIVPEIIKIIKSKS